MRLLIVEDEQGMAEGLQGLLEIVLAAVVVGARVPVIKKTRRA